MTTNVAQRISMLSMIKTIVINRALIYQLTKREIIGRYRGSILA